MAKIITQETYDEVIKENIVEFSMSVEEAKKETIEQFEAQGINLANIIKDLNLNEKTGEPILKECIEKLQKSLSGEENVSFEQEIDCLDMLTTECNKSVPHRILAGKLGAMDVIIKMMEKEIKKDEQSNELLHKSIVAGNAITNKQPDIFDDRSLNYIINLLDTQKDQKVLCDALKWMQKSCLLHEKNRQLIVNANIMTHLKPLLENPEGEIVKEVCIVFRFLVLDDDIRVEFGKAHDHARCIADEVLKDLTHLLTRFKEQPDVICELILTIAALCVRSELCLVVQEAGGLKFMMDAMVEFSESQRLIREVLKLFKALAGNDSVKLMIINNGAAPLIESALNRFKSNEVFAKVALGCISTLALRVQENSTALFETGIAETIVQTMKIHEDSKVVQRNGAWSIRNMVARAREQCDTFIGLGVEEILNLALKNHPSIAQDVRSALRDLGCKVQLLEEWKGQSEYKIAN